MDTQDQTQTAVEDSISNKGSFLQYKKFVYGGLAGVVLICGAVLYYSYKHAQEVTLLKEKKEKLKALAVSKATANAPLVNPIKKEFGKSIPEGFPPAFAFHEKGILSQSYALDYGVQKQLTTVFSSQKTVQENYAVYQALLAKEGWQFSTSTVTTQVASVYGKKDKDEMNITISEMVGTGEAKSQVSISIIKR